MQIKIPVLIVTAILMLFVVAAGDTAAGDEQSSLSKITFFVA
jgi:hypothetical protein